jgi:hypothetical protein
MSSPNHKVLNIIGFRIFPKGDDAIAYNWQSTMIKSMPFLSAVIAIDIV